MKRILAFPALRVLIQTIEHMAGTAHREKLKALRTRLGWFSDFAKRRCHRAGARSPTIAAKRDQKDYDVLLCYKSKD